MTTPQLSLSSISDSIETSYCKGLTDMDPVTSRHFLFRLYLSNKNARTASILTKTAVPLTLKEGTIIQQFNDNFDRGVHDRMQAMSGLTTSYPHLQRRYDVWRQHPDLVYFYTVLRECFYYRYFKLPLTLDKVQIKSLLGKLIETPEFIQTSSTHAICIYFYLEYIDELPELSGLTRTKFLMLVREQFHITINPTPVELFNYLYALTHMIICDSYFYQRKPNGDLKSLASELVDVGSRYYDQLSMDLKAEIQLSCMLLESIGHDFSTQVERDIMNNFRQDLGIVDNLKKSTLTLQSAEHTNSLCLLIGRIDSLISGMGALQFEQK